MVPPKLVAGKCRFPNGRIQGSMLRLLYPKLVRGLATPRLHHSRLRLCDARMAAVISLAGECGLQDCRMPDCGIGDRMVPDYRMPDQ